MDVYSLWSYGCVLFNRMRYRNRSLLRSLMGSGDRKKLAICAQVNESEILHRVVLSGDAKS